MSIRVDKVQSTLNHEISSIIQRDLKDPHLGFITVTEVHVSGDLQHATVFFSVLGDQSTTDESLRALQRAAGFIHNQLSKKVHMKRIPSLTFRLDTTIERGARIFELLHQVEDEPRTDEPE